jgi:hypothetical protein
VASEHPPYVGMALRPCFPCTGADLEAARDCEQVVFGRRFGNSAAELADAYDAYQRSTSFGAVFAPDGTAVAAVRLLRNGPRGLKSLNDAAAPPWGLPVSASCRVAGIDPARTWDVATFGVDDGIVGSSRQATFALLSVFFGALRDNEVVSFVAILDAGARRPFRALGVELLDLPGASAAPYLGSAASVPVYQHVADLHREHLLRFAGVHEKVFHGHGVAGLDPQACRPGAFGLARASASDPAAAIPA